MLLTYKMKIQLSVFVIALLCLFPAKVYAVQVEVGDAPANSITVVASSQKLPVKVDVVIEAEQIKVGDEIPVTVRISARPDVALQPMDYKKLSEDLDVLAVNSTGIRQSGTIWQKTDRLVIQTFLAGDVEFPALVQKYKTADGQLGEFRSAPITMTIAPLPIKKSDKPGTIRGLKKPAGLFSWWLFGIIMGVLLCIGGLVWWYLRRTGNALFDSRPKTPPRPAHEVALERLDALSQTQLLMQNQFKVYYSELSDILRRYIEGRFHTPAIDMTTHELLRALKREQMKTQDRSVVSNVLSQSDMVKFAKMIPNEKESQTDWQSVRDMVVRTTQVEDASEENPPATKEGHES